VGIGREGGRVESVANRTREMQRKETRGERWFVCVCFFSLSLCFSSFLSFWEDALFFALSSFFLLSTVLCVRAWRTRLLYKVVSSSKRQGPKKQPGDFIISLSLSLARSLPPSQANSSLFCVFFPPLPQLSALGARVVVMVVVVLGGGREYGVASCFKTNC